MPDRLIGSVIDGRYKILSRLGSGGMADVYLAEDQQLSRKIALKLLYRRFAEDPGFVERFRREAQAAAGLQHPNVVSVYDRGAHDGTYYIAMEYVPGRTLKQLIRDEAPLDPVRAINITTQILRAARFAHKHGVIHRDLKPHNVIVDESDQAKVTDFGIARAGASDMTETGSILGTAQYLSPEQAQGHAVSASSDLYSIGVVLYEMLTGHVPFDAEQAVTIAIKHVSEAPMPVTRVNPAIPAELEQVVMWALNKNPADRPADADQFIAALDYAKAGIRSGVPAAQRTESMAAVSAAAVSDIAAMTPYPRVMAAIPPSPVSASDTNGVGAVTEPPEPPRERRRWGMWLLVALLVLLLAGGGAAAYVLTRPTKVAVTPVVGEQLDIARTQLQNDGFKVAWGYERNSHRYGYVLTQSPNGGIKATKGSTVSLTVSSGPGNVTVPPVQGETPDQARQALATVHLKVGAISYQHSATVPQGAIISSSPTAGQSAPPGSAVDLVVSSGPATVTVPSVVGQTLAAATATLQTAGFQVATTEQTSSTLTAGQVMSQTPAGATQAAPGSTVALVIAKAPPKHNPPPTTTTPSTTVTVPDVKGDTAAGATSTLHAAGFSVASRTREVSDQAKDGIVLSESPPADSSAKKGATVTITVGQYKAPVTTPTTTTTSTSPTTTTTTTTTTTSGK